ncbi:HigA family addiction module antidote protein [Xylophilus rhododendri]|uniref:HigA family addiction module antidote protein n=1 Tax=Xylophilus rhododendri TaxID=2697032 RepID=A0A857JAR0_9BURK|nr:HigA family addiction module antitoxin [Xylophilus rhododendri]QHJ01007.1 HigA family addiction module antidote protein [Xylophilus rhododendri]
MFHPSHPGETLREDVLPALNLTVTRAAEQLGVSRVALTRVLQGQAGISIELARRLEQWLRHADGTGPTAESWLRAQLQYDLWQANRTPAPHVAPAPGLEALSKA